MVAVVYIRASACVDLCVSEHTGHTCGVGETPERGFRKELRGSCLHMEVEDIGSWKCGVKCFVL